MQLKQVNPEFWVADQITAQDIELIAARGIKTVFCNRPDGEGPDQPNVIEIEQALKPYGIQIQYLPVVSGKVTDEQAEEFKQLYL